MTENLSEQAFCKLLAAIAAKLGDGWTAEPEKPEGKYYNGRGHLKNKDGQKLHVRADEWQNHGRLSVSMSLNRAPGQSMPEFHTPKAITVSYSRTPAAIAADIKRRILPDLVKLWQKNEAAIKRVIADEQQKAARLNLFCSRYAGRKGGMDDKTVYIKDGKVELSYESDKVFINLRHVPQELALCVLDIYHAAMTQGTQS